MLFNNKYRIESARLKEFDYTSTAWYYVTICTEKMHSWFGKVKKEKVELSIIGKIVFEEWIRTKEIRTSIDLDEFIIIPNHIHGIIIINDNVETTRRVVSGKQSNNERESKTTQCIVSTTLKPNSLGAIIGQFKSVITKRIRKECNKNFAWQPRFYDHVIRNQESLDKIRNYIHLNPIKWEIDEYFRK